MSRHFPIIGTNPVLDEWIARMKEWAEPFILSILDGSEREKDVLDWMYRGGHKSMSDWQSREMGEYIEDELERRRRG